jgi:hypothetical protein
MRTEASRPPTPRRQSGGLGNAPKSSFLEKFPKLILLCTLRNLPSPFNESLETQLLKKTNRTEALSSHLHPFASIITHRNHERSTSSEV